MSRQQPPPLPGVKQAEPEAAVEPEAVEPDAVEPETVEPESVEPETVEPETVEPQSVEPETVEPETVEPETVEPETVEPETVEPEDRQRDPTEVPSDDLFAPPDTAALDLASSTPPPRAPRGRASAFDWRPVAGADWSTPHQPPPAPVPPPVQMPVPPPMQPPPPSGQFTPSVPQYAYPPEYGAPGESSDGVGYPQPPDVGQPPPYDGSGRPAQAAAPQSMPDSTLRAATALAMVSALLFVVIAGTGVWWTQRRAVADREIVRLSSEHDAFVAARQAATEAEKSRLEEAGLAQKWDAVTAANDQYAAKEAKFNAANPSDQRTIPLAAGFALVSAVRECLGAVVEYNRVSVQFVQSSRGDLPAEVDMASAVTNCSVIGWGPAG